MYLVTHQRMVKEHRAHMERLRNMKPYTDTSTPSSLGLKHLATRPKKQQLIEDRHQVIAMENKNLMAKMTKIMSDERPQLKHERPASLNELERKLTVDAINFDNKLMLERLKKVGPTVLERSKTEEDFRRHKELGSHMRRKQLPPIDASPTATLASRKETFDASSYLLERSTESGLDASQIDSPIKSMAEFRKHIISKKVLDKGTSTLNRSMSGGGSMQRSSIMSDGDSRYELTHSPTTKP